MNLKSSEPIAEVAAKEHKERREEGISLFPCVLCALLWRFWSFAVSSSFLVSLASLVCLTSALAQNNKTWNGSASSDWFNADNWTPAGVPAANDTINFTNGTINLSSPVTVAGQFNWAGGRLQGNGLTIAANGVMNLLGGGGTIYLLATLTNAGTVNWLSGDFRFDNCLSPYGPIINLPGGLWDIQCDQTLGANCGPGPNSYFQNLGTVQKSAGTGATSWNLALLNQGTVTLLQGTLNLNNGGAVNGSYYTTNGTALHFNGGGFTSENAPTITGSGVSQFTGGSLLLLSNTIPNLPMVGGTVTLGTNFQGGSIANLTLQGSTLSGNYVVSGLFNCPNGWSGNLQVAAGGLLNWSGGRSYGILNVVSNGLLNLTGGGGTIYLQGALTNAGTVSWMSGDFRLDTCLSPQGPIINLPGGLWDIHCDQLLGASCGAGQNGYFQNLGTVRKSTTFGTTTMGIPFLNLAVARVLTGTLALSSGGFLGGTFEAMIDRSVLLTGGNFTSSAEPLIPRPGSVQFTGGNLSLASNTIPTIYMAGGTVTLGTNFQGGTITNLALTGSTLSGNYTVAGRLFCDNGFAGNLQIAPGARMDWSGGKGVGTLNVASNGLLNLTGGGGTLLLQGALTNAGTVSWINGDIRLDTCLSPQGPIVNLSGGLWDIQSDQLLGSSCGPGPNGYFQNFGTVRKSAGTGATAWNLGLLNQGAVTLLEGTLNLNNGGVVEGSYSTANGTALHFNAGGFTSGNAPVITGSGVSQFTGGNLLLLSNTIANLPMVGGTVTLGTNFQGGSITNLTLLGSSLSGDYAVSGVFNCPNGWSGNLQVAGGGLLNWSGGKTYGSLNVASNGLLNLTAGGGGLLLQGALTNGGTVSWLSGDFRLDTCLSPQGPIINLPGGLWDIQCDQLLGASCGEGPNGYFQNFGTVRKGTTFATTIVNLSFINQGSTVASDGTLAFNNGFSASGGGLQFGLGSASDFGRLNISGSVSLEGNLKVQLLGGFVPALSNSFALVTYGSSSGSFKNVELPPAAIWQTNYGANAFSITVGSVSKLVFGPAPAGTNAGSILAPVVVQVQDVNGSAIPTNGILIALSLASGRGPLGGILNRSTDATGKAVFDDLSFNLSGVKTLQAAASGGWVSPTASAPFAITSSVAARLVLVAPVASPQPASTLFSPAPTAQVLDQFGNVVSNSTASITLTATSSGGGSLAGVTTTNANGTTGSVTFSGLRFNLADPGRAESVVLSLSSPGLSPATNTVLVGFPLSSMTLRDQNSVVRIDPTNERGLFSWVVDNVEQAYQHWFWLGIGSNAPQTSVDHLGTAWGLASNSTNALLSFLAQGLALQLGFTLQGDTPGSFTSSLAENLSIQNVSNAPVVLHFFEYSDFDLADQASADRISLTAPGNFVQRGKGMVLTEIVASPAPLHWEARFYDFTLGELDGPMPLTLADAIIPDASGDQTFLFQWEVTLAPGQSVSFSLSKTLAPGPVALAIASQGTNLVVSWSTNSLAGLKLRAGVISEPTASWQTLTNVPEAVGGEYQVKLPLSFGAQSFRLQK